jgi:fermentation-respiration switch protein FrsA (DUF1100 family)
VRRAALNALLYFPDRTILQTPADVGLEFDELQFSAADGTPLHGWWIPTPAKRLGHVLLAHGNAGNIGDRVLHAQLLTAAGFDVLLFDYRGYGRSAGRPDEPGTYADARGAREALLARPGIDPSRVYYLGESLGGAVALRLALEHPPAGLVLMSTFLSVRAMARVHYPFVPPPAVPDAYPSLRLIGGLRCPLLVVHGADDAIVPLEQAQRLFDAAPQPKQLRVLAGVGHNDLVLYAGEQWAAAIAMFAR